MDRDPLSGSHAALRFVIDSGVPAQLRLVGGSMEPTLPQGAILRVAALGPSAVVAAGDVVVIAAVAGGELIVHRVLQTFAEVDHEFIVHQGDAPGTSFGVASRQQVLARVTAVCDERSDVPRPIGAGNVCRFAARRLVALCYLAARRLAGARSGRWAHLPRLEIGLTLRLDLRGAASAPWVPPPAISVREISRPELEALLGAHPALARHPRHVDEAAPHGWRCFMAAIGGLPAHVSFVETRVGRPLLFGVVTEPAARRRGLFRATVRFIAGRLESEGSLALWSSVAAENGPSVRAHRAVGFTVVRRSLDVGVGEMSMRAFARRILRGA